jgi:hypothetical protein
VEKVFLFDVLSKIYVATDSSPVDIQTYELCCDMIDVVVDVSCIYGMVSEPVLALHAFVLIMRHLLIIISQCHVHFVVLGPGYAKRYRLR